MRRIDHPSDCALLVAIPLTRDDFLADLQRSGVKDYALSIKRLRERANEAIREYATSETHWAYYEPVALVVENLINKAERLGVRVIRKAALADLTEALGIYRIVTLASHWIFTLLRLEDIVDVSAFLQRLRDPGTAGQMFLADRIGKMVDQPLDSLVEGVNMVLMEGHSFYRKNPFAQELTPDPFVDLKDLARFTKIHFEREFVDCVKPKPSVEFFDRMYSVPEVVEAIPASFDGLLDLTICNSVVLGHAIKLAGLKCDIAVSRYKVEPIPRFRAYLQAIEMLSVGKDSYMGVLTKIFSE